MIPKAMFPDEDEELPRPRGAEPPGLDIRSQMRKGNVHLGGGQVKIGGKTVREDGTAQTKPPIDKRKAERRKKNKAARKARR